MRSQRKQNISETVKKSNKEVDFQPPIHPLREGELSLHESIQGERDSACPALQIFPPHLWLGTGRENSFSFKNGVH